MSQIPLDEYVVTLVAASGTLLSSDVIQDITQQIGATRCVWLAESEAIDIFCAPRPVQDLYALLNRRLSDLPVDVIVQDAAMRRKKLLLADMEATVIEQEMLDELADVVGLRARVSDITRRAMNGALDFESALRERLALIKSQPASVLENVAKRITITPGASELIGTMKANGAQCWLVSSGFTCFAQVVARQLGFDAFFANELIVRDNIIAGEVAMPILDKNGKKALLDMAQTRLGLSLADIVTIGDGANDIPMLSASNAGGGLGVAFRAKPSVRHAILPQVNYGDLTSLLYAQGYKNNAFQNFAL